VTAFRQGSAKFQQGIIADANIGFWAKTAAMGRGILYKKSDF
jgi:hypothetical protein